MTTHDARTQERLREVHDFLRLFVPQARYAPLTPFEKLAQLVSSAVEDPGPDAVMLTTLRRGLEQSLEELREDPFRSALVSDHRRTCSKALQALHSGGNDDGSSRAPAERGAESSSAGEPDVDRAATPVPAEPDRTQARVKEVNDLIRLLHPQMRYAPPAQLAKLAAFVADAVERPGRDAAVLHAVHRGVGALVDAVRQTDPLKAQMMHRHRQTCAAALRALSTTAPTAHTPTATPAPAPSRGGGGR